MNMPRRENYIWKNYGICWKSIGTLSNISKYKSWMTLAKYTVPLYVIIVIFGKRRLTESRI